MIEWTETEYHEYYKKGTVRVTAQQKGDPSMHFFDHERDFLNRSIGLSQLLRWDGLGQMQVR